MVKGVYRAADGEYIVVGARGAEGSAVGSMICANNYLTNNSRITVWFYESDVDLGAVLETATELKWEGDLIHTIGYDFEDRHGDDEGYEDIFTIVHRRR